MRYEKEMRSPLRKGTVPSLAMSVPSKDIRMSPSCSSALAGDVGSTLLMYTPFWPAYSKVSFLREMQQNVLPDSKSVLGGAVVPVEKISVPSLF